MKRRYLSILLVLTMIFSITGGFAMPAKGALLPHTATLTITPSQSEIDVTSGSVDVIYTLKVTPPAGQHIGVFSFDLKAPAGMTLSTTKVSTKNGDGYWINNALFFHEDFNPGGIFATFSYTPNPNGYFIGSGTTPERNMKTEADIMTIKATITDASKAGSYALAAEKPNVGPDGTDTFTFTITSTPVVVKAAKAVTGVIIKTQPTKLSYIEGQALDLTGLQVTLTYDDSSTEEVALADFAAKGITTSPVAGTALTIADHNSKPIEVSCNGKTANTNNLTVAAKTVTGIAIKAQPTNLSYVEGQNLDLTGLEVTLTYDNDTTEDVIPANFAAKGITTSPAAGAALTLADNDKPVVVSCNDKTANTNNLTVAAKAVTSVTIKSQPTKLSYIEGQDLDLTGLVVTLTYNDSTTEEVALADFAGKGITTSPVSGTALTIADHNNQPVVVSCNGKTANTNNLTVEAKAVTGVAIKTQPTQLSYVEGQDLDLTGLEVTLTYDNNTTEDVIPANFAAKGITTSPAAGAALTLADNDKPVVVSCNGKTANTNNLTVEAKAVTAVTIKTQPTKLSYLEGQDLDLTGLEVTLTYDNNTTEDVALINFVAKGITTSPAAGTALTIADHNDKPVVVSCNGKTANTNNLTVEAKAVINIAAISGVTAPVRSATPVTTIAETEQFTGNVTWAPTITGGKFAASTIYTASITLTPKAGYTLTGVPANFFTVAKADSVTNDADSGIITAVFPKTAAASGGGGGGVVTPTVTGVAIKAAPDKVAYTEGDALDLSGLKVTLTYSNGTTKDIALADFADNKITVSPKAGDVLDAADTEIVITVNGKTIKQAITVEKKTVTPPVEKPVLTDIDGHWAQANIEYLVGIGAVAGYPDETFRPDALITRAEFAKVIVDAFELTAESGKVFTDTADHWAKDYVAIAAANGIVLGYNDKEFGPEDLITREQMAIMIVKAAGLKDVAGELSYSDKADVSSWAYNWVVSAIQNKIMSGYTDNTFKPLKNATRAEAATVIYNVLMK